MQDPRLQPIFCDWAAREYNLVDVAKVEFFFVDAVQWSDITFDDASVTVVVTLGSGEEFRRVEMFNGEFMSGLIGQ